MRASKRRGRRPRTEPDQAEIKPRWAEIAEIEATLNAAAFDAPTLGAAARAVVALDAPALDAAACAVAALDAAALDAAALDAAALTAALPPFMPPPPPPSSAIPPPRFLHPR